MYKAVEIEMEDIEFGSSRPIFEAGIPPASFTFRSFGIEDCWISIYDEHNAFCFISLARPAWSGW
jgi:hypothetical protein